MVKFLKTINRVAEWAALGIGILVVTIISVLVWVYKFIPHQYEPVVAIVPFHILAIVLAVGCGYGIDRLLRNKSEKSKTIICSVALVLAVGFVIFVCGSFVLQAKVSPISDSWSCLVLAERFFNSDFSAVVPNGSYIAAWPYQTGIIFIFEKQMRLLGSTDFVNFQLINVFFYALIIVSGYHILRMYSRNVGASICYLLLMCTYAPFLFWVYWIYGNFPSLALMMFSMWMFMLMLRSDKRWKQVLATVLFVSGTFLAGLYKMTTKVYLTALVIVVLFFILRKKKYVIAAVTVLTALLTFFCTDMTKAYYEHYANNSMGGGVPSVAYFAMAMQKVDGKMPGEWNGFHVRTFEAANYDTEETARLSKEALKKSFSEFREDPQYAARFFYDKLLHQWANQTHGAFSCIKEKGDIVRDDNAFWVKYINNEKYWELNNFIDLHESVMYGFLFLGVIAAALLKVKYKLKRENDEIDMLYILPIIMFIGGFLFSLVWEAQTHAVMYYPIILLPFSVAVLSKALSTINIKRNSDSSEQHAI